MSHKALIPANEASAVMPMAPLLGHRIVDGDVGIEVEVEGNKFKKEYISAPWQYVEDHSLRGEDNAEYVLRHPIKFSEVPNAVNTLWDMMEDYGSVLDDSNRTSVHVHLNFGKAYKDQVCCFTSLFYVVEEILMEWCGSHRVGNLFCLRGKDAPGIVSKIKDFLIDDQYGRDHLTEGLHYANLNIHALRKMGSIEIRGMRGVDDPALIVAWVGILERIYKLASSYSDPREICEGLSGQGPLPFVKHILGDYYELVRAGITFSDQEVVDSAWTGIRLAQDLCYCRDWSKYVKPDLTEDPFGRRSAADNPYGQTNYNAPTPQVTDPVEAFMSSWNPPDPVTIQGPPPFEPEWDEEGDF